MVGLFAEYIISGNYTCRVLTKPDRDICNDLDWKGIFGRLHQDDSSTLRIGFLTTKQRTVNLQCGVVFSPGREVDS
jgi:hypothetical protein